MNTELKILKGLTERQRSRIINVWKRCDPRPATTPRIVLRFVRGLMWNTAELALLISALFFGAPESLLLFVIGVNWATTILGLLSVGKISALTSRDGQFWNDEYMLSPNVLTMEISRLDKVGTIISAVLHICILLLIAYSGHPYQATILLVMWVVLRSLYNNIRENVASYLNTIESDDPAGGDPYDCLEQ